MGITVRQELDTAAIRALLTGPDRGVTRDLLRRGLRVTTRAKRLCKADQGRLRGSIMATMVRTTSQGQEVTAVEVGTTVKYARAVHDGTGIYGPTGIPITAKHGALLVFTPRKSAGTFVKRADRVRVFARSVKGQRPNPFLKNALPDARG